MALRRPSHAGEPRCRPASDSGIPGNRAEACAAPHFDYTTDAGYALGFAALDFTPDGRLLAVALENSNKVVLLDTIAGKE